MCSICPFVERCVQQSKLNTIASFRVQGQIALTLPRKGSISCQNWTRIRPEAKSAWTKGRSDGAERACRESGGSCRVVERAGEQEETDDRLPSLEGEMSVNALAKAVGLSQSALSQHLAKLRALGTGGDTPRGADHLLPRRIKLCRRSDQDAARHLLSRKAA